MPLIWNKPVTSPKAWRGDALKNEQSWIVRLTDAEIAEIDRALAVAKATGLPVEEIQREHFPLKVWADCNKCPRQAACDEVAVTTTL